MTTATTFRLPRPSQRDLVFDGELIAYETSKDDEAQTHWTEIRIYRTANGEFVTEDTGYSTIPGQVNKVRVYVCTTPEQVRKALERTQKDRNTGQLRTFLRDLAIDAIDAASVKAPELKAAIEERI